MTEEENSKAPEFPGGDEPVAPPPRDITATPCFDGTDRLSFAITTLVALAIYLWTLAPEIDLGDSGIFSTGAMYPGVPHVPGYPVWTLSAALFVKLFPVSNVAWRLGVASALCAALACGMVALLGSCGGRILLNGLKGLEGRDAITQKRLRLASGFAAGMGFGFSHPFWNSAPTANPWPLSLLLLSIVLAVMVRWQHTPAQTRWLHLALFAYGLTLTNSQALLTTALGLQFLILFASPALARDFFGVTAIPLAILLAIFRAGSGQNSFTIFPFGEMRGQYAIVTFITGLMAIILVVKTRAFLTHWKTVLAGGFFFGLGLSAYLLLPILSMTNPPMNWGYARTWDGFLHVLSRGQYEPSNPTHNLHDFIAQAVAYIKVSVSNFGFVYLATAIIPFFFVHRMLENQRKWLLGWLTFYLMGTTYMLVMLNMPPERMADGGGGIYFSATYLVLAMLSACGLAMLGAFWTKPAKPGCILTLF